MLALGLNIVVGWAGLLDLGYIAFFGFGAYGYALFSSHAFGNLPLAPAASSCRRSRSIPIAVVVVGILGVVVGLVALRLVGDYLAIVTLFFGQAFAEVVNNVAPEHARRRQRHSFGLQPASTSAAPAIGSTLGYYWFARDRPDRADGGAAPARHLAHRPRLARGARRPARRRGDDDPRQPAQGDGVRLRRGGRRARRHASSPRSAERRLLDQLHTPDR